MLELILIGLALTFIGSMGLMLKMGLTRAIYAPVYYQNNEPRYLKLKRKDGVYAPNSEIDEGVIITSSYILLCLGFLIQFVGYLTEYV